MTIELTDEQLNQIFEGFDWYQHTIESIDQDLLDDFLDDNIDMLVNYLNYRASDKVIKTLKETIIELDDSK